jgi:putative nucleotidyltransferase with HDIG domain
LGLLSLTTIALGMMASTAPWYAVFLPLTITAMILTLAYNPQFALLMSVSLALATIVALGLDLGQLLVLLSGLATAVLLLRNVRTRTRLVKVAAGAGLAFLVMTVASGVLSGQTWGLIATDGLRRFVWGILAGFLLTGLLPLVERLFGIVTDISLLELADGAHPLLQELVRRAPGTYTHSMTVATLAEGAAEAIDANPLLTRVGAYFHDVGKMLKPQYFIENQGGANRHDTLEPALSTLIIIGHVKDGAALVRQYNLPRPILDAVEQHHGTTLIEYFYREALRQQEQNCQANSGLEPSFRYPGPKPQNRENGILMLADAVESTSRTLHDPTPGRLRKLVHDLLMKRLLDGQFDESGLTLTELHRIEESLCKGLIALFHARIRYPEEQLREKAAG